MDVGKILKDMKIKIPGVDMTGTAMVPQLMDVFLDAMKDEPCMQDLMQFRSAAASPPRSQPLDCNSMSASERTQRWTELAMIELATSICNCPACQADTFNVEGHL